MGARIRNTNIDLELPVLFAEEAPLVIGRLGFFDRFVVILDGRKNVTVIESE